MYVFADVFLVTSYLYHLSSQRIISQIYLADAPRSGKTNSRRLILGLRPRQANRNLRILPITRRLALDRPDLHRGLLLRDPNDGHHGAF